MIHAHMKNALQDEDAVDEIGEKHITSRKHLDASPPTIFMEQAKFNKSSPIRDLSFFESDLIINQDYELIGQTARHNFEK